jgi:hypothetical protein
MEGISMGRAWQELDHEMLDRLLGEYFTWVANWDELRDWEQAYLKAL